MPQLFLVTESVRDDLFYRLCANKFSGHHFEDSELRFRTGSSSSDVKARLKDTLRFARGVARADSGVLFIAAIDNDRAPHPENEGWLKRQKLGIEDRDRPPHLPWMERITNEVLGPDKAKRAMRVVLAVPVEMLESWTVRALDGMNSGGPAVHFSLSEQPVAKSYYTPSKPPPQWKDLEQMAREASGCRADEAFYDHVVTVIAADPKQLRDKSPSFAHFHDQLTA